jgi:D-amino-acid dehydrogenase
MQHVIVIGGGVVGLTSAWWLLESGCRVTLVERAQDLGSAASMRNGGQLSYRYVSPLADAGVPLKAIAWLLQEDGPLRFKPEASLHQWDWLARFLYSCRAGTNQRTAAKLLELGEFSRTSMSQLELALPLSEFSWRDAGKLVVYRSTAAFKAAADRPAPEHGRQVLSARECVGLEPALAAAEQELAGGIFTDGEAVADCHAFCQALGERLRSHPNFDGVVQAQVHNLVERDGKIDMINTSAGIMRADAYVLAAGIQSRLLAASAGIKLPLYPLKGYSLTAPIGPDHCAPDISVTDFERKILYARIGADLSVAAMVDMVGEDTRLDPKRIDSLIRQARNTMPNAANYEALTPWAGLRPATPGGAPIIGASKLSNLWLNVGHGALGFTFACGSAAILARLFNGAPAPFDLQGLTPP